jgi:uroporphyrinogen-III decarboxylase
MAVLADGELDAETAEILDCFRGNPRLIVRTGDQVGRETPEDNLHAMVDEVRRRDASLFF